jgi:membrane protein required for colicin V production
MMRATFGEIRLRRLHSGATALVQSAPRERPRDPSLVLMNLADYLVIAAVIISAIIGAMRGFLREAVALVTLIVAIFLAWHFADLIEPHLGGLLAKPPVSTWAARAIVFFIVLLIGMAVGSLLSYFVRLSLFSGTDRFLGFVFGLLRGIVLLGVFVILGQLLHLDGESWWKHSRLIPYGESIANGLRAIVGEQMAQHGRTLTHSARFAPLSVRDSRLANFR